ncbi:hypothetical protein DPMN_097059 [Dreissena polymorpha]|uniref:Aspartic peptidase DDI1-type domain-containing protein n=1 Tax=Dreissena polymorpha TaxID=45954 RepID=A0A9D4LCJ3_DREPO|nr:hypothetical protein DPMN_097059 [Dreissena polymorpha]
MFGIPLKLQSVETNAVIDTAAEVPIISDMDYHTLPESPRIIKKLRLNTADRDMSMSGFVCGPLTIKIGESEFEENVYVAPIQDDMLLGLDFMRKYKMLVNIPEEHVSMGTLSIPMLKQPMHEEIASVTVCRTTVIPPSTFKNVECGINKDLTAFVVEQCGGGNVAILPTLYSHENKSKVCVINMTVEPC